MTLIVAVDDLTASDAMRLTTSLCGVARGFKIGLPYILRNGADSASLLRKECPQALWVADLKLADIGYVMKLVASALINDVDAVIAHGFVGLRGALDELKEYLDENGKKLVVVATMSHPGAREVYDKVFPDIIGLLKRLQPWGVVVPATRPETIAVARSELPGSTILSPGVGAQGARPGTALCRGADYEIVGRLITRAPDPLATARRVVAEQEEMLRKCKGLK